MGITRRILDIFSKFFLRWNRLEEYYRIHYLDYRKFFKKISENFDPGFGLFWANNFKIIFRIFFCAEMM